ncbi:dihydrolipoyl dehydrogenase [Ampullimonas aquatilis]|uniref:dihydrolipoyl dehydrogenase n=1 Tax=Ampullimonas aquatilis TaxID=1341549 RepID=UPI003C73554E
MSKSFDVIVIGAGPGGYIGAIRAAQLGLSVACIEKWKNPKGELALGGTCLNVGCIPSKALLASSEEYEKISHSLSDHGISVTGAKMDVSKMLARKDGIVTKMTKGIEFLFRKNKITWLKGHGKFTGKTEAGYQLEVIGDAGSETVTAKNVIIATGSKARHLPDVPVDNVTVCDNEGALNFSEIPKKLAVIGAGVIGLELGSVWRRLGAEVTVLEMLPTFLAACDESVSKEMLKSLMAQGLKFSLGVKIGSIKQDKKGVKITYTDKDGAEQVLDADKLIVSIGRVPNTDNLGLDSIGIATNERGFVEVDGHCKTSLPGLFAIGDVVRGPMLAHKGEEEGVMVAEIIAGQAGHTNYDTIPYVIYTSPEVAWVGKTEQQLKTEGVAYKAGQFPFAANGRALGQGGAEGFVKVLADAKTDRVLGVHIVNTHASDLIAEAVMAMEFSASSEDIGRICHAHPSLSEVVKEAALAADKRALNM